ncbi:MAG: hypothetical protein RLZZ330_11 [Actinomycetota bacterium]|jgi:hypothetical protein
MKKLLSFSLLATLVFSVAVAYPSSASTSSATGLAMATTDGYLTDFAISSDGKYMYTATSAGVPYTTNEDLLLKIDTSNFEIVDTLQLESGFDVYAISINPDDYFIYVGGYNGDVIAVETEELTLSDSVQLEEPYQNVLNSVVSADGEFLYLTTDSGYVVKVRLQNGLAVEDTLHLTDGSAVYAGFLSADDATGYFIKSVWESNQAPVVYKVNLSNMTETSHANLNVGEGYIMDFMPISNTEGAYITNAADSTLIMAVVNLSTLGVTTHDISDGYQFHGPSAISADKKTIYTFPGNDSVYQPLEIDVATRTLRQQYYFLGEWQENVSSAFVNPVSGDVYISYGEVWFADWSAIYTPSGVDIIIAAPKAPGAPRSVKAVYAPKKTTFSWATPANDGGAEITGYKYCYLKCTKAASWKTTTKKTVVIKGIAKGTSGTFEVRAVNSVGAGEIKKLKFKQAK